MTSCQMGDKALIVVGDIVDVLDVDGSCLYHGIVRYCPCAPGDSWRIETEHEIAYVQTFGSLVKRKAIPLATVSRRIF